MVKEKLNSSREGSFIYVSVMTEEELVAFGLRIKRLRNSRRMPNGRPMTQTELGTAYAVALGKRIGKKMPAPTAQAVSKWENRKPGEKGEWPESQIMALAEALGVSRDILMTGKEISEKEEKTMLELRSEAPHKSYPLYPLSKITAGILSGDSMGALEELSSKSTNYPFAGEGRCFNVPDDSMEPKIDKGSFVFIRLGLQPNPGDFVVMVVKETGNKLFRVFNENNDSVSFRPLNPSWSARALSYPREEWQKAVDIIGVASSFETQLRID